VQYIFLKISNYLYMKKFLVSDVARWVLSVFGTTLVASGIVYAATITDVRMQTIVQGDTIGVGWYQSVNDRLAAFSGTGSSGSSLLPCFYAPTQTIVTHGTTYVVYMKPQPSGDN
jgi:hypothetical protein